MCFCQAEVTRLFRSVGPEFLEIVKAADELRARVNGEKVKLHKYRKIWFYNFDFGVVLGLCP